MSIPHEHSLQPVTAIDIFLDPEHGRPLVLVGEGLALKLFDSSSGQLLAQKRVFDSQIIHGVVVRHEDASSPEGSASTSLQAVIWGGASVAMISDLYAYLLQGDCNVLVKSIAPDWIMDAAFSPECPSSCALVTAHNALFLASLEESDRDLKLRALGSPSRSILYAAHLVWDSAIMLMIAAGTVFGEIIVWRSDIEGLKSSSAQNTILHTFTGHEGSIFGVNISPLMQSPDGKQTRLLASCSDDRTIRVWDLSEDNLEHGRASFGHDHSTARETGFGENSTFENSATKNRCIAVAMGHASRIWRVKIVNGDSSTSLPALNILSFGEDATCQQWTLSLDNIGKPLVHAKTFTFHSGKHIWSAAVRNAEKNSVLCVTGGADGGVASYRIPLLKESVNNEFDLIADDAGEQWHDETTQSWSLQDIEAELPPKPETEVMTLQADIAIHVKEAIQESLQDGEQQQKPKKKKKLPKPPQVFLNRYAFLTTHKLIATTSSGSVLLANLESQVKWKELSLPGTNNQSLRSYAIITGVPQAKVAFMAGANGTIYMCSKEEVITEVGSVQGKVAGIFPLSNHSDDSISLLITTLGSSDAVLLDINTQTSLLTREVILNLPLPFVVTSAGCFSGFLILGSRNGSLAIYDVTQSMEALQLFVSPTGQTPDAVTSIIEIPYQGKRDKSICSFLTTCRDGVFNIFTLSSVQSSSFSLQLVHTSTPPFGPLIEAAWFSNGELYLYGFRSKSFVLWNETTQREIDTVDCGGAHRSFAYSHNGASSGHLVYTKASRVYIHTRRAPSHRLLQVGGHGREIKSCAISPGASLLATAAEDTCIRLWKYNGHGQSHEKLKCLAVIPKHTAGLQQLSFFQTSSGALYLCSSAGNEEFYIWAIVPIPEYGIGIRCVGSCPPPDAEIRDLRITSFDVQEVQGEELHDERQPFLLITLALSDSTMRIYHWSPDGGFEPIGNGRYTAHCITHLRYIQYTSDEQQLPLVLTASTDGYLGIFRFTQSETEGQRHPRLELSLIHRMPIHQNSIKSLDLTPIPTINTSNKSRHTSVAAATGGDDGALAITTLRITSPQSSSADGRQARFEIAQSDDGGQAQATHLSPITITRTYTTTIKTAHAAAVSGVTTYWTSPPLPPVSSQSESKTPINQPALNVVSSSTDQHVRTWWVRGFQGLQGELVEEESEGGKTGLNVDIGKSDGLSVQKTGDVFTTIADVGDVVYLPRNGDRKDGEEVEKENRVIIAGVGLEILKI